MKPQERFLGVLISVGVLISYQAWEPPKARLQRIFWFPEPGYLAACLSSRLIRQLSPGSGRRIRSEDVFVSRCIDIFRPRPLQIWWGSLLKSYQEVRPELGEPYDFSSDEFWFHQNLSGLENVGKWWVIREAIGEWSTQLSHAMGSSAPPLLQDLQEALESPSRFLQRVRIQQQGVFRFLDRHPECARQPLHDLRQGLLFQKEVLLEVLLSPVPSGVDAQRLVDWLQGLRGVRQMMPFPVFMMQFQDESSRCGQQ